MKISTIVATGALLAVLWAGCTNDETGSLLDTIVVSSLPAATISSITPAAGAQAGIDTVVIVGTNFDPSPGATQVYFNGTSADLLTITTTGISLKAPFVLGDSVRLRVVIKGSQGLSPFQTYKLESAITEYGNLGAREFVNAMTSDGSGNLYVGIADDLGRDLGIFQYAPDGTRTQYTAATAGVGSWSGMKFGPGGYLYVTRNFRAIWRFNPGGSGAYVLFTQVVGSYMYDFDFDQNQNMWIGGNNANIYRLKQDKTVRTFPFSGNLRSVRVFNSNLYVAGLVSGSESVWRIPIQGDTLGTPVQIYNLTSALGSGYLAQGIDLSSTGTVYLSTSGPEGIVMVEPSGASSTPFAAYSGLFASPVKFASWRTNSTDLYASTTAGKFLILKARIPGAPLLGN